MDPDWLGSPQHLVGAALVAGAVTFVAPTRAGVGVANAAVLGIGAAMTAQVAWEVLEYLIRYADEPYASAYYDTIADSANALMGAFVGAGLVSVVRPRT